MIKSIIKNKSYSKDSIHRINDYVYSTSLNIGSLRTRYSSGNNVSGFHVIALDIIKLDNGNEAMLVQPPTNDVSDQLDMSLTRLFVMSGSSKYEGIECYITNDIIEELSNVLFYLDPTSGGEAVGVTFTETKPGKFKVRNVETGSVKAGLKRNYFEHPSLMTRYEYARLIGIKNPYIYFGEKSPTFVLSEGKRYTFGVEIETSSGAVPKSKYLELNMHCKRDGSIPGGEYITEVLTGDAGFMHLQKICNYINSVSKVDNSCGLHVHVGGTTFSKSFTVSMFVLALLVEKNIFQMLPKDRYTSRFCQPMYKLIGSDDSETIALVNEIVKQSEKTSEEDAIDKTYDLIFKKMSGSYPGALVNKNKMHPEGRYNSARYYWANIASCNFIKSNTSDYTIEFRPHSGTINYIKIRNWILICFALVFYAENKSVLQIIKEAPNLNDVIRFAYNKNANKLIQYINKRTALFATSTDAEMIYEKTNNVDNQIKSLKDSVCV